jgi:hypothetical protein
MISYSNYQYLGGVYSEVHLDQIMKHSHLGYSRNFWHFCADLQTLTGCFSCLFSTGSTYRPCVLGVFLLSRAHPIRLGLSMVSVRPSVVSIGCRPGLAAGSCRYCFSFLSLVVFLCQCLSASRTVAKLGFRVAEQGVC